MARKIIYEDEMPKGETSGRRIIYDDEPPRAAPDVAPPADLNAMPVRQSERYESGNVESGAMGALNDMTLGGSDELYGVASTVAGRAARAAGLTEPKKGWDYGSAGGQTVTNKVRGPDGKMQTSVSRVSHPGLGTEEAADPGVMQDYRQNRDSFRGYLRDLEKEHPKSYMAGGFVGSGVTAPLMAGPGGKLTAKALMGLGGAYGLMSNDSDLTTANPENYKDAAASTAFGAGTSLALGKTFEKAAEFAPKIPGAIRSLGQKIENTSVGGRIANSELARRFRGGTDKVADAVSDAAQSAGDAISSKVDDVAQAVGDTRLAKWVGGKLAKPGTPVVPGTEVLPEGSIRIMDGNAVPPGGETKTGAGWRLDPEDISDEMVSEFVEKHADKGKKFVERLGLDFPSAEDWAYRDLDLTGGARHRINKKGIAEHAAQELLKDRRYALAKTLEQKKDLIATKLGESAGKKNDALKHFSDLAQPSELIDPVAVAARVEQEVLGPLRRGSSGDSAVVQRVEKELESLMQKVPGEGYGMPLTDAADYLQSLDKHIPWNAMDPDNIKLEKKALKRVRGILNGEIESKVKTIADRVGQPEVAGKWKDAKRSTGSMAELLNPVEKRAAARDQNRVVSLTDYLTASNIAGGTIAGGAGLIDGELDPADVGLAAGGFAATALANKWGRERGAHVLAQYFWKQRAKEMARAAAKGLVK